MKKQESWEPKSHLKLYIRMRELQDSGLKFVHSSHEFLLRDE